MVGLVIRNSDRAVPPSKRTGLAMPLLERETRLANPTARRALALWSSPVHLNSRSLSGPKQKQGKPLHPRANYAKACESSRG
jgi:hypothetical protein